MNEQIISGRRKAALDAVEIFASENGFDINDCPVCEVSDSDQVTLTYTAPDGRKFWIGYKPLQPR